MDFYFDIGMAVILRVIKDRRAASKYYAALAKLFVALSDLQEHDGSFAAAVKSKRDSA